MNPVAFISFFDGLLRHKCYQFTHAFEDIEVKQNAPELLEQALKAKRQKTMIGTGSMSDP